MQAERLREHGIMFLGEYTHKDHKKPLLIDSCAYSLFPQLLFSSVFLFVLGASLLPCAYMFSFSVRRAQVESSRHLYESFVVEPAA